MPLIYCPCRVGTICGLITACAVQIGCASLINGTTQDVTIASDPPGAQVFVLTKIDRYGRRTEMSPATTVITPGQLRLARRDSYWLLVEKPGYALQEVLLPQRYSNWAYVDLLSILLDLMVINEMTGGLYAFDDVHVTLIPDVLGGALSSP